MLIPDYDEFNIYTTMDDVEYYVDQLLIQGFELKEENNFVYATMKFTK